MKKPDTLIHLAWEGLPNYDSLHHIEKNLYSSYLFCKSLIEQGLKDLTVIGTCFEYGMQNGCISEDLETRPMNSYALAKDTLHKFLDELHKKINFSLKWVRLFYLYGEGQNKRSILEQLKTALQNNEEEFKMSGGEQLRDYLPVEKVAEYFCKIALQTKIEGSINCCSGQPISIRKLVENYLEKLNRKIKLNLGYYPYNNYEPFAFWGDNSKLKKIIGE
jgi:dTDP-6-deoxy-L-talose 4-dehydrogenase (NAD+)